MKNLKITLQMLTLLLIVTLASCKKDNGTAPEVEATPIATDELLGHYITLTINGDPSLRLLYFSKEGNEINATLDYVNARRVQTVNLADNTFSFDFESNNQKVYTFKLAKDDAGKLSLSSYSYKNQSDANIIADYAQIDKVSDAPAFKGKTFVQTGVSNSYLMFPLEVWVWNTTPTYNGVPASDYYIISPGAWKGNRSGADYIGIGVPRWKDNTGPVMLVQKTGAAEVAVYKAM
ncbi:MAG: hypothetical protein V4594_05505 [Bacteroidota bacterium]